ncbi:MAG: hypothetical protein A2485_03925 [Bdellovibrionales bacterium RIFOXYC12_FULL_39_17]|nr:MAG: hypothetical protein A2485_03925 [Bdellovibrionales bacterium RIFOXYC12_FULL_39_17]
MPYPITRKHKLNERTDVFPQKKPAYDRVAALNIMQKPEKRFFVFAQVIHMNPAVSDVVMRN